MDQSVLYLECSSGISGDMTVAALLDLGADRQVLADALTSLPLSGYSIEIKEVYKSGLRACDFNVVLEHDNHDHDMEYLHGRPHGAKTATPHDHIHEQALMTDALHDRATHGHPALAGAHERHHTHKARNLQDITEIINAGELTDNARRLALRIFRILAEAEASVHGKSVGEVHFHEVGAVDSIVDIVAAAVCLDNLHPARVVVSPLVDGSGRIRCQHGIIPVPVPAVTAIAAQNGLTLKLTSIEGELVTPTGAAIAAALTASGEALSGAPLAGSPQSAIRQTDPLYSEQAQTCQGHSGQACAAGLPAEFRIRKVGLGAGKRDYATTGVLRAMLLEPQNRISPTAGLSSSETGKTDGMLHSLQRESDGSAHEPSEVQSRKSDSADTILSLESNIDDCTGEALSFTMQELLEHGALDVFYVPIYMKKNRPAYLLRVLCHADRRAVLESIIFKNTTTIGIRVQEMQRTKLPRQIVSVETPWGVADVKCCTHHGDIYYYPENDSVCKLARKHRIGFPEMYHLIQDHTAKIAKK